MDGTSVGTCVGVAVEGGIGSDDGTLLSKVMMEDGASLSMTGCSVSCPVGSDIKTAVSESRRGNDGISLLSPTDDGPILRNIVGDVVGSAVGKDVEGEVSGSNTDASVGGSEDGTSLSKIPS